MESILCMPLNLHEIPSLVSPWSIPIPGGADPKDPSQMLNDPEMMKARPRTSQKTGDVERRFPQNMGFIGFYKEVS